MGRPPETHPSLTRAKQLLAACRSQPVRTLLRYWISIHPGDRLPGRQHVDPLDIPELLKHLVVIDIAPDGARRFKVRVMGTAVTEAFGEDFTGRYLEDAVPNFESSLAYRHRVDCMNTGLPSYRLGASTVAFKQDYAPIERIHLPLARDGRRVDMILSLILYEARR